MSKLLNKLFGWKYVLYPAEQRGFLCTCGNTLGEMYLDCFEDGSVELREGGVRRVYE